MLFHCLNVLLVPANTGIASVYFVVRWCNVRRTARNPILKTHSKVIYLFIRLFLRRLAIRSRLADVRIHLFHKLWTRLIQNSKLRTPARTILQRVNYLF